jgi:hypothetical protein
MLTKKFRTLGSDHYFLIWKELSGLVSQELSINHHTDIALLWHLWEDAQ